MKGLILCAVATVAVGATSASAASITECGNYVPTGPHHGYWTNRTIPGYTPVYNLTTRRVTCSPARKFSLGETKAMAHKWHGYACNVRLLGEEDWDIRCTRGSRVIHWQGGA